jgi:hypothetical protein
VSKEIKVCICYKLLVRLLLEIKRSDGNLIRSALLTRILADVPAQTKHRIVCLRMAINKNFEAKNFRIAARLIKVPFT